MKWRNIVPVLFPVILTLVLPAPAHAGGLDFGISIGTSHFGLSFGYSSYDYPVYGPGWRSSNWSLTFATALDGYGSWIEVGGLGRVWHPWVAADWRPYTYGRWVFTSLGWTWVAYEPWGYFPHHYGSWAMTPYGWVWVPGYTYVPANVTWLSVGGTIGWCATPPYGWSDRYRAFRYGYRRGFAHGYEQGYWNGWDDARYANFVDSQDFTQEDIAPYVRPGDRYVRVSRSQIRRLPNGPDRARIARVEGRPVPRVRIDERQISISGRRVRAVRPHGVTRSIEAYAGTTVRKALAPSVTRRLQVQRTSGRTDAPSWRTRSSGRHRVDIFPSSSRPWHVSHSGRASAVRSPGPTGDNHRQRSLVWGPHDRSTAWKSKSMEIRTIRTARRSGTHTARSFSSSSWERHERTMSESSRTALTQHRVRPFRPGAWKATLRSRRQVSTRSSRFSQDRTPIRQTFGSYRSRRLSASPGRAAHVASMGRVTRLPGRTRSFVSRYAAAPRRSRSLRAVGPRHVTRSSARYHLRHVRRH